MTDKCLIYCATDTSYQTPLHPWPLSAFIIRGRETQQINISKVRQYKGDRHAGIQHMMYRRIQYTVASWSKSFPRAYKISKGRPHKRIFDTHKWTLHAQSCPSNHNTGLSWKNACGMFGIIKYYMISNKLYGKIMCRGTNNLEPVGKEIIRIRACLKVPELYFVRCTFSRTPAPHT